MRNAAGMFDVSHMGEVDVLGPQAGEFLDHLVTNDVSKLFPGRVLYSPMCYDHGGVVDDLLIYMRAPDDYFLCINAGNIEKDLAWIYQQAAAYEVSVTDRSDDYALLAIQGPRASAIVQTLTGSKLDVIKYYHFEEGTVANVRCLISRTGYTGEDGFELYHEKSDAPALAKALLKAGESEGLVLAGLGARDSLRLEAGYPLYGHEITADVSPLSAGLGWTVKLKKASNFVGKAALVAEKTDGSKQKIVFFKTGDRRIVRPGAEVITADGAAAGTVVSGTLSPMLNEAIGSALVSVSAADDPLVVDIRGTKFNLHLVKPPFLELKKAT